MKCAMLFGGAGFIGREVTRCLSGDDFVTVCADNNDVEPEDKSPASVSRVCDVRSSNSIYKLLLCYKPPAIFWFPARQGYYADYSNFARTQYVGTYALFEAIDKVSGYIPEAIILSSSQAIYSPCRGASENSEKRPPSVYGLSKLHQEKAFRWFCRHRAIPFVALRYSIVLGGGQALQSTESGVIRNWFRAWHRDRRGEVYGKGTQYRDFVHVKDVAESNILALRFATELGACGEFNISGPEMSINDAFSVWKKLTGCRDSKVLDHDVRPGGEYDMTSHCGLANAVLKWNAKRGFEEMLKDFLESAKKRGNTPS
jgi:UDP-glucose 4-epimerase